MSRKISIRQHLALSWLTDQFTVWRRRTHDRRHLQHLDAHTLKDMGLTCAMAAREARRPFWRAIRLGSR